jgi:hypothetical protein
MAYRAGSNTTHGSMTLPLPDEHRVLIRKLLRLGKSTKPVISPFCIQQLHLVQTRTSTQLPWKWQMPHRTMSIEIESCLPISICCMTLGFVSFGILFQNWEDLGYCGHCCGLRLCMEQYCGYILLSFMGSILSPWSSMMRTISSHFGEGWLIDSAALSK